MKRRKISFRRRQALRLAMYIDQHGQCALCHTPLFGPRDATIDHIKPVAKGGTDDRWNLQLVHKWCNVRKGDEYLRAAS